MIDHFNNLFAFTTVFDHTYEITFHHFEKFLI